MTGTHNDELEAEISQGEQAAIDLVLHLQRMRSLGVEMPVLDDLGNMWIVKVERWPACQNTLLN